MMYDKSIEDEQEGLEWLVEKGESALPALKKYMIRRIRSRALRLLTIVDAKEGRIDVIAEVLARHEPAMNATRPRRSSS
jgi:hypothetical protein